MSISCLTGSVCCARRTPAVRICKNSTSVLVRCRTGYGPYPAVTGQAIALIMVAGPNLVSWNPALVPIPRGTAWNYPQGLPRSSTLVLAMGEVLVVVTPRQETTCGALMAQHRCLMQKFMCVPNCPRTIRNCLNPLLIPVPNPLSVGQWPLILPLRPRGV